MDFVAKPERENVNRFPCKVIGVLREDALGLFRRDVRVRHSYMIPDTGFARRPFGTGRAMVTINNFRLNPKRIRPAGEDITDRNPWIIVPTFFLCHRGRTDQENE